MKKKARGSTARATGRVEVAGSGAQKLADKQATEPSFWANGSAQCDSRPLVHVAVVHGAREVRFVVAATGPSALYKKLCHRLARYAPDHLWEEDARAFFDLRGEGQEKQAIELYFRKVGDRWDAAWLSVHRIRV